MNTKNKLCIVYGNCQAKEIAKVLSEHKAFSDEYRVEYVCNHDSVTRGIVLPTAVFADADVLIYQPLHDINIMTKKECVNISFPYIYNSGVFAMYEENDYVHGAHEIRKMRWLRVPVDAVVEMALRGNLFFDLKYRFEESLQRLFNKEVNCDIKVTQIIMENVKVRRVFYTQNHIANAVLFSVINVILNRLYFQTIPESDYGPERMSNNAWPVSPYDVSELGLKCEINQGWDTYMEHCIRRVYSWDER